MGAAIVILLAAPLSAVAVAAEGVPGRLGAHLDDLGTDPPPVLVGEADRLFLRKEIRSYSVGRFWGDAAAKVARSARNPDPLPAIVDFHRQLEGAGIALLVVPVPGKIACYEDAFLGGEPAAARWDVHHRTFHARLREEGVAVLDLVPAFRELRASETDPHCRTDAHWSPAGMALAAERIAARLREAGQVPEVEGPEVARTPRTIAVQGDLAARVEGRLFADEELDVVEIALDGAPVASDADSPLILIGDSHCQVYSTGLLTRRAGLPDHLAAELGFAPEVVTNQGSGANAPRGRLARRGGSLPGKTAVVWVFVARDYTESFSGWQEIPVIRD